MFKVYEVTSFGWRGRIVWVARSVGLFLGKGGAVGRGFGWRGPPPPAGLACAQAQTLVRRRDALACLGLCGSDEPSLAVK